jgi:hypothetical protein
MRLKYAAAALQLLASAPVLAWSEETHMTTGAMAFDDIAATNPELLAQIKQIILAHPHYKQLSAHAGAAQGSAKTRVIFEYLARWPDDMNGTMYEHRDWHYELRVVHGRTWLWPFRNGNASEGFDINYRIFADKKAADVDRAIALGWLLHIIGDIQQPLHAGHQMTSAFSATVYPQRRGGPANRLAPILGQNSRCCRTSRCDREFLVLAAAGLMVAGQDH